MMLLGVISLKRSHGADFSSKTARRDRCQRSLDNSCSRADGVRQLYFSAAPTGSRLIPDLATWHETNRTPTYLYHLRPITDLPNLRFSFSDAHMRLEAGGWTRQVTRRELGAATALAGVNMRLKAIISIC
ncbi:hypothetical protein ABID65_009279 [Bradyrhizobium sp. S3.9.2]